MSISMKATILFSRPYSFKDKDTGKVSEGVKIQYYPHEDLQPLEEDGVKGKEIMFDTLPIDQQEKITLVPGLYNLMCEMGVSKDSYGRSISRLLVKKVSFISDFGKK